MDRVFAFPGICRGFMALGTQSLTSKAGSFWQTGFNLRLFSTRTKSERFTSFSGRGPDREGEIQAQYGPGLVYIRSRVQGGARAVTPGSKLLFLHGDICHSEQYLPGPGFSDGSVLQKYALYGLRFPGFPAREVIIPEKTVIIRVIYIIFTSEIMR